jgi:hypothetical protein
MGQVDQTLAHLAQPEIGSFSAIAGPIARHIRLVVLIHTQPVVSATFASQA